MLFHKIEGAACVLRSKGIYRQVDVYQRGGHLFARWGSGFIGLRASTGTTLPHVSWELVDGVQTVRATTGPLIMSGVQEARRA